MRYVIASNDLKLFAAEDSVGYAFRDDVACAKIFRDKEVAEYVSQFLTGLLGCTHKMFPLRIVPITIKLAVEE